MSQLPHVHVVTKTLYRLLKRPLPMSLIVKTNDLSGWLELRCLSQAWGGIILVKGSKTFHFLFQKKAEGIGLRKELVALPD